MIRFKQHTPHQGFTLIELMLAMTFVSVLLLAIAMTVIQIGNIYSKGMALKDINQSGRLISDDLKRTVAEAGAVSLNSESYVLYLATGMPVTGRLCLGNYTYLWNTVDAATSNDAVKLGEGTDAPRLKGLAKVPDSSRVYCAKNASGGLVTGSSIRAEDMDKVVTLLVDGDHDLALNAFAVNTSDRAFDETTGQRLFTIDYIIGTGAPSAMNTDRTACLAPGDPGADPTYCNVQQFNLIVRSGGGK